MERLASPSPRRRSHGLAPALPRSYLCGSRPDQRHFIPPAAPEGVAAFLVAGHRAGGSSLPGVCWTFFKHRLRAVSASLARTRPAELDDLLVSKHRIAWLADHSCVAKQFAIAPSLLPPF